MPDPPTSAYLDANAIIRFFEGNHDGFALLLRKVASGAIVLHTSELTLAEVLVKPLLDANVELTDYYEEMLTSDGDLSVWPVTRDILRRSAGIRASWGNKGADAIHVATAMVAGCPVFVSSDKRVKLPSDIERLDVDEVHVWTSPR